MRIHYLFFEIQQAVVAKSDVVANNKKNSTLIFKMLLSIDNLKQT